MGKAERNRAQSARARIAAQQAAARKAEQRRRVFIAGGGVLVVLIVVIVLIVVKPGQTPGKAPAAKSDAAVAAKLTSIPASTFDAVGAGPSATSSAVSPLIPITAPALTSGGKPEILYLGAEYCPYCAAERWSLAAALSRFGTFSGLHFIHSRSQDYFSNTATLDFYRSAYSSKYLVFTPIETQTVTGATLQNPTAAQSAVIAKYDAVPYVPQSAAGKIPFIDFGGAYLDAGAQYSPSVLGSLPNIDPSHFGLTWAHIANDLQQPGSPVAQSVLGAANRITAAVCKLTHGQPGNVCQSAAVTSVSSNI
jgi:hypothetical protein